MAKIVYIGQHAVDISLKQAEVKIIQDKTPVRTGNLRDGFHATAEGDIINDVYYGIFVELGTGAYYQFELGPPLHPGWPHGFPGRYMVTRSEDQIVNSILERSLKDLDLRKLLRLPDEIVMNYSGDIYGKGMSVTY